MTGDEVVERMADAITDAVRRLPAKTLIGVTIAALGLTPDELARAIELVKADEKMRRIARTIIRDNPDKAAQATANPRLSGWFVGQTMKALDGVGDVAAVARYVDEFLAARPNPGASND